MTDPLDWDLDEVHTSHIKDNPHRKTVTGGVARCVDCGLSLDGPDRAGRRCAEHKLAHGAAVARERRSRIPANHVRSFTCQECGVVWATEDLGNFKLCPSCRSVTTTAQMILRRTKTCAYRHCGKTFTDDSSQNSSKFCTVECRRREKMFRSGKAADLSYFRK